MFVNPSNRYNPALHRRLVMVMKNVVEPDGTVTLKTQSAVPAEP